MFLRNAWYVFGWVNELDESTAPVGRVILGEPVVVWCDLRGNLHAMENRCPHRHTPLSMGRVEGENLICMYHGMTFDTQGRCVSVPLMETVPQCRIRVYPVIAQDSWIWIWMGDPELAHKEEIPRAFGLDSPDCRMRAHSIEYEAHYQLIHDNLCDLSHVDYVHAGTLKVATGADWSLSAPRVTPRNNGVRFERWFEGAFLPGNQNLRVDVWSSYEFIVPGIFIMQASRFPLGTAEKFAGKAPSGIEPIISNVEQQAVTPISPTRTAYHYATGFVGEADQVSEKVLKRMEVVMAAFEEDRKIIEAQQKIWDLTPSDTKMLFLPQDKGPYLMRKLMQRLIDREQVS